MDDEHLVKVVIVAHYLNDASCRELNRVLDKVDEHLHQSYFIALQTW